MGFCGGVLPVRRGRRTQTRPTPAIRPTQSGSSGTPAPTDTGPKTRLRLTPFLSPSVSNRRNSVMGVNGISNFPKTGRSKFPSLAGSVVSRFSDLQHRSLVGDRGALALAAV